MICKKKSRKMLVIHFSGFFYFMSNNSFMVIILLFCEYFSVLQFSINANCISLSTNPILPISSPAVNSIPATDVKSSSA